MISVRLSSIFAVCLVVLGAFAGGAAQAGSVSSEKGGSLLAGDEPSYLDFGAGVFDIQNHRGSSPAAEGRIEFRYGKKFHHLGPAIGLLANTQGGVFGYAGIYADLDFGQFVLTPLAAVGGYRRGNSEDLGEVFQFRLSADLSYQFEDRSRLGLQFAHISDAGITRHNPGDNELLVTYAIPVDLPF